MRAKRRESGSNVLESPAFVDFIARLRDNTLACDAGGKVLRLKRYVPSTAKPVVIDAVLEALKENTKIEALYLQNFEDGVYDEQLMLLLDVLRRKRIWCLNVGENFRTTLKGWKQFAEGLEDTAVAYMYASEHHFIGTDLKTRMRDIIRVNRNANEVPRSLSVIRECKNMWFNPKLPSWAKGLSRKSVDEDEKVREAKRLGAGKQQLETFLRDSRSICRGPSKRTIVQTEESLMYRASLKAQTKRAMAKEESKPRNITTNRRKRRQRGDANHSRAQEELVLSKPTISSSGRKIRRIQRD